MLWITTVVTAPILLIFSVPLAVFAVATTTFAFWILLFRVAIVYAELFTALLRAYMAPSTMSPSAVLPLSTLEERSPPSKRTSSSSSMSPHLLTRGSLKSQSSATIATSLPLRDYEGVGGWRLQEDDQEEALWMGINSRLELPVEQQRRHHRTLTGGSRVPSGVVSPQLVRTPLTMRTPGRHQGSGTTSPEEYFNGPLTVVSNTDRGSKVSFEGQRRSGSSSTTSLGSVKLMTRQDGT